MSSQFLKFRRNFSKILQGGSTGTTTSIFTSSSTCLCPHDVLKSNRNSCQNPTGIWTKVSPNFLFAGKKEALRGFRNPTPLSNFFKDTMEDDDDEYDPDGFVDDYYDEIIRHHTIARRTNWRIRYTSLSQREVALATNIEESISDYGQFLVGLILLTNQLLTTIYMMRRQVQDRNSFRYKRILHLFLYYNCLMMFCFYEFDTLLEEDDRLMNIRRWQWAPLAETPPRNRSIDELSDEDARSLTRFNKEQLRLLLVHWRIPEVIITEQQYRFSREEMLIVGLTKLATGDPWTRPLPGYFGSDVRRWSKAFIWFVNHLFILFYHKISGNSMDLWLGQIESFKRVILDRLAQPAHPIERELFDNDGHPERAQYIIQCAIESWRVYGFLDDTAVRTCRPGSGPVGPGEGPGRPRRNNAYDIQRAFYRLVCVFFTFTVLFIYLYLIVLCFFLFVSGYFKGHGLKYQNILLPNGMAASVFGASASHNDVGVLNLSRLQEYLEEILFPDYVMDGGLLPVLYGDAIFQKINHTTIISRYKLVGTQEEIEFLRRLKFRMSGIGQSIEHMYGQLFNLFRLLKTPRQFKLYNGGQLAYRVGVI